MQRSMLAVLCLVSGVSGCGRDSAPPSVPPSPPPWTGPGSASGGQSLFPNLDTARLKFPNGWDQFKERVQDAQIDTLNKPITVEEAPAVAAEARKFATADRRGHPASLMAIPQALLLCAQAYARAGDTDKALELLEEVKKTGGLFTDMLANSAFDGMRDTSQFKALVEFAEQETEEEVFGGYVVRSPPLFPLDDLLAIPADPPLPSAAETKGKVTVVYTGPKLTPDAIEYLEVSAQQGASVHAIVTEGGQAPSGVTVHIAKVKPEQLIADATPITWFADKNNQVVAFLRPFSGAIFAKAIIHELSTNQ